VAVACVWMRMPTDDEFSEDSDEIPL
jgi:hypothetical protein